MLHVKSGIPKPRFLTETQFAFRASSRMSGLPLPLSRMHQNQTASAVAGAGAKLCRAIKDWWKKKKNILLPWSLHMPPVPAAYRRKTDALPGDGVK